MYSLALLFSLLIWFPCSSCSLFPARLGLLWHSLPQGCYLWIPCCGAWKILVKRNLPWGLKNKQKKRLLELSCVTPCYIPGSAYTNVQTLSPFTGTSVQTTVGLLVLCQFLWAPCITERGILSVEFHQGWLWIKNIFAEQQVQQMYSIKGICEQPEILLLQCLVGSTVRLQKWQDFSPCC